MAIQDWGGYPTVTTTGMNTNPPTGIYTPGMPFPAGRAAANGKRIVRVDSLTPAYLTGGYMQLDVAGVTVNAGTVLQDPAASMSMYCWATGSMNVGRNTGAAGTTYWTDGGSLPGPMPGRITWSTVPVAPTIGSVVQATPVSAVLSWTAPSDTGDAAITGYRIQYATNAAFTGATTLDVGNVTSYTVTGLTAGQRYWFRVAAVNGPAAAASTSSVYSGTVDVTLVAEIGDLDGWESFGTLPAGLTPLVATAVRRGSVYPIAGMTGLLREIQCSGSGGPIASGALGIRRTMTGLTIGATYRLAGKAIALAGGVIGNRYRFAVTGIGTGGTVDTIDSSTPVTIPDYTFTATATSHVIRIDLAETASWSGAGWWEAVAFYEIKLYEVPNTAPYRLQDTVYEGPLSTHFDYACDTVGAAWWVDTMNVTRFRQAESQDTIRATFTDVRAPGKLEYVDVAPSYDTRATVNSLTVNNHGRDAATGAAADFTYTADDAVSIDAFGIRSAKADWTMRAGYVDAVNLMPDPRPEATAGGGYGIVGATLDNNDPTWKPFGTRSFNIYAPTAVDSYLLCGATLGAVPYGMQSTRTYTWSATGNVKLAQTGTISSARARKLVVIYRTASSGWIEVQSDQVPNVVNTPTRVSVTFTLPAGTVEVLLRAYNGHSNGEIRWAGFRLSEGYESTYMDGGTPSTADYAYAWTGTPNASTSTRRSFVHLRQRIAALIAAQATPAVAISSIRWNAQENPTLAAQLDVQDRIRVEYRGAAQTARIVGIRHDLTGSRWMVTLDLAPST